MSTAILKVAVGVRLPDARLQHVKRAFFDRELHVLHVAVVFFEQLANFFELLVNLGHPLSHFAQVHWRADTGHHVLALRVDQEIAIENLLAGRRIAREANSRAGIFAVVAEHHLNDVDGRARAAR